MEVSKNRGTPKSSILMAFSIINHLFWWFLEPHGFVPAVRDPAQVKADLEMLRNDGLGAEDPQTALKQRLLDLTKKNRRLQVELLFLAVLGEEQSPWLVEWRCYQWVPWLFDTISWQCSVIGGPVQWNWDS